MQILYGQILTMVRQTGNFAIMEILKIVNKNNETLYPN